MLQGSMVRAPVASDPWGGGTGDPVQSDPPGAWEDYDRGTTSEAEASRVVTGGFHEAAVQERGGGGGGENAISEQLQQTSTWRGHDAGDVSDSGGGITRLNSDCGDGNPGLPVSYGPTHGKNVEDAHGDDGYDERFPMVEDAHDDDDEYDERFPMDDSAYVHKRTNCLAHGKDKDEFDGFLHPHEIENYQDQGEDERCCYDEENDGYQDNDRSYDEEEEEWWEMWSARDNDFYYHNKQTDEVVWDPPEHAIIIRYGTGPDGGAPYYSPFNAEEVQKSIESIVVSEESRADPDEFLRLPELRELKKTVTMDTDISFGTGVPALQFSFDGKNDRDLDAFLEYYANPDGRGEVTPSTSFAGAETPKGGSSPRTGPLPLRCPSPMYEPQHQGSPPRNVCPPSSPKETTSTSHPPRDPRSSPPLSPRSDKSSPKSPKPSASPRGPGARHASPPSSIFNLKARNRYLNPQMVKASRAPPPLTTALFGPLDTSGIHASPFMADVGLVNRDSASLSLDEDAISELLSQLPPSPGIANAPSLQGLPSLEAPSLNGPIASLRGAPSLSGGLPQKTVSTDIDSVFGRSKTKSAGESSGQVMESS